MEAILATYQQVDRNETFARCIHALGQTLGLVVTRRQPQEICTTVKAMYGFLGLGTDNCASTHGSTTRHGRSLL